MLYWGVIGSGDVVSRLVRDSFNIPGKSSVKYIYSKNYAEAKQISNKFKLGKAIKNIKLMLKDKQINCVYIATPPSSHAGYVKQFAKLKKNILCEKPLAINLKDISEIIKICKKHKVNLVTSFYRRYLKRFKMIKNILDKKKIGRIITFRYNLTHSPDSHPTAPIEIKKKKQIPWRFKKTISGGGNFLDMGAHAIYMIIFLLGDIKKIQSIKKNYLNLYKVEDTLIINIELKNKIVGQALWSSVTDKTEDAFEIFGTKGTLKFSLNFNDKVEFTFKNKKFNKFVPFDKPFHKNLIKHVIKKFYKNLKNKKSSIEYSGINVAKHQISVMNKND